MSYILNTKACWQAQNSHSSSFSFSSVVICASYWTFGAILVPVCRGRQPCPVISPDGLSRFSAVLQAPTGSWWEAVREAEDSRVFGLLLQHSFVNLVNLLCTNSGLSGDFIQITKYGSSMEGSTVTRLHLCQDSNNKQEKKLVGCLYVRQTWEESSDDVAVGFGGVVPCPCRSFGQL